MVFQGEVKSVAALLKAARNSVETIKISDVGRRNTAAQNASACRTLLAQGKSLDDCWRFGILQTLDDYQSTLRRGGTNLAAHVFAEEPPPTSATELDAAFAALADHLAQRDRWQTPTWAHDPSRKTTDWYPSIPAVFRDEADRDSPKAFRQRGILITSRSLARA